MPKRARSDASNGERLLALSHGSFVSSSGRESLLGAIRDHGLPTAFSRRTQLRARQDAVAALHGPHGPIIREVTLPLTSGDAIVPVQSPIAMLHAATQISRPFCERLLDRLRATECSVASPWGIILYSDEISPQNPLAAGKDHRKIVVIYWSLEELGDDVKYTEEAWFTLAGIRSELVSAVPGGMTHVFHHLLPLFFGSAGPNLRTAGMVLWLGDVRMMMFCDVSIHVSDEPALAAALGAKGHAGTKPCPACRNITSRAWADPARGLQPITSIDRATWQPHSDATVRAVLRRLAVAAETMTAAEFKTLETMMGWKHCPGNIMSSAANGFRPISTLMFDWMHVFVNHGLLDYEIELFATCVSQARPRFGLFQRLHAFIQPWTFPRQIAAPRSVFIKGRFNGTASQQLSIAVLLAHWCREEMGDICPLAVQSLLSLCYVIELLREGTQGRCTADALDEAIMDFARKHQLAHGLEGWVFKHHQALHLGGMMRSHGVLLSCFLMERLHKRVKRFMLGRLQPRSYERGIIEQVTLDHLHRLQDPWHKAGLCKATAARQDVAEIVRGAFPTAVTITQSISSKTTFGLEVYQGDVVMYGRGFAGQVWYNIDVDGVVYVAVAKWNRTQASPCVWTYAMTEEVVLVQLADVKATVVRKDEGNVPIVFPPLHIRVDRAFAL